MLYLHLADLLQALEPLGTQRSLTILDYGCGPSPYRHLFPNAKYLRADAMETGDLDYHIGENGRVDERAESFDVVLSTQVLEHVRRVPDYLKECRRLLRPGGQLILTTHGIFEEHGCPSDYRRWTADGLREECEAVGFKVEAVKKLTTSGRALAFLLDRHRYRLWGSRRTAFGFLFSLMHQVLERYHRPFHRWCDRRFADSRVVDSSAEGHSIYIALLLVARKV